MNVEKAIAIAGPIFERLIGFVMTLLPFAIMAISGKYGWKFAK